MSVIDGIFSGLGSALGGVLGYYGQREANKTNIQLAREANQNNLMIAREANEQNYKMFKEQQQYDSPENQRKMLEEAGYNPASLTGGNYTPLNPNAPQAIAGNPQVAAHVGNELAYMNQLGDITGNVLQMAQAKKANAEADNLELVNQSFMTRFEKEMESLGLQNKWQEIKNEFDQQKFPLDIKEIGKRLELTDIQISKANLEYDIYKAVGKKRAEVEIDHLKEQMELWKEQRKTEITQQDLNKALGKKAASEAHLADVNAWYKGEILESEKAANYGVAEASQASAEESRERAKGQSIENSINELTKNEQSKKIVQDWKNAIKTGKNIESATRKLDEEARKIGVEIEWTDFNERSKNKFFAPFARPPKKFIKVRLNDGRTVNIPDYSR